MSDQDVAVTEAIAQNRASFRDDFPTWLAENYHVFARFCREANKIRARGRTHYSARTIIEVLRHESALTDTGQPWKLNDHYTPDMARLYMLTHTAAAGLFETRVPKASERAA